jgi:hypothetical protein
VPTLVEVGKAAECDRPKRDLEESRTRIVPVHQVKFVTPRRQELLVMGEPNPKRLRIAILHTAL